MGTEDKRADAADSDTGNEYRNPGANYPDREDTAGIEPPPDELRPDPDVAPETPPGPDRLSATQDGPLLDQNVTTAREQIVGIADQVLADLGPTSAGRYEEVLSQRFSDAGLAVPADRTRALAQALAAGESPTGFNDGDESA